MTGRRYPPYAQITDPYQRRRAIVDLHAQGWSNTAISAYLQTPRHRVYEVLKRWARFGHAGLDDTPQRHARKTGIREINEVGKLVVDSPELGAYRVRAALEQIGIHLSQATCGRLLSLNRKLYGLSPPKGGAPNERREMPFKARFRFEYWSVDVRYIEEHGLGFPEPVYMIARKMSDAKFARARSWEEMLAIHRSFVNDYHVQRRLRARKAGGWLPQSRPGPRLAQGHGVS